MAAVSLPQKSTTVRKNWKLSLLRSSFAIGAWLMPGATLQRAFRLFGTPMPGGRFKAHTAELAGASVESLAYGHEQVTCYRWGDVDRQPLAVLAHGWSGHGLQMAAWVAPLRRAGYAVVTFDQIAHGRSTGCRATLPLFADVLARVTDHYGGASVLVAHSLGGAAAMIALSRGMRCDHTVLIAPAGDPLDAARRFGGFVGLPGHLSARLFEDFEALTGIDVDDLQVHRSASRIAGRALVVHDLEDREVPWCEGERYARYWPAATLLSTQGLGHNRVLSDPSVLAQSLSFLGGTPVGERVVSSPNLPFGFA